MIQYTCPYCHHPLQIPEQYAGTIGRCRHCNEKITVPKVGNAGHDAASNHLPESGTRKMMWLAVGAVVAAVCTLMFWQISLRPKTDDRQSEVTALSAVPPGVGETDMPPSAPIIPAEPGSQSGETPAEVHAGPPPESAAGRVFVNMLATGRKTGASWADAFTSLEEAAAVAEVEEIWVAEGSYRLTQPLYIPDLCRIRGGFAGHERLGAERNGEFFDLVGEVRFGQTASIQGLRLTEGLQLNVGNDGYSISSAGSDGRLHVGSDGSLRLTGGLQLHVTRDGYSISSAGANGVIHARLNVGSDGYTIGISNDSNGGVEARNVRILFEDGSVAIWPNRKGARAIFKRGSIEIPEASGQPTGEFDSGEVHFR